MFESLEPLKTLADHQTWEVEESGIQHEKKEKNKLKNLVHFIEVIQSANRELEKSPPPLSTHEISVISSNVLEQAFKIEANLNRKNKLLRTALKIAIWLQTGTTLESVLDSFRLTLAQKYHISNDYAARLKYPELVQDAEKALESLDHYRAIALQYADKIPKNKMMTLHPPQNAILWHLRQKVSQQYHEIITLLKAGKTFEDPTVMEHCDIGMQLSCLAQKLTIKYETILADEKIGPGHGAGAGREFNLVNKTDRYSWLVYKAFDSFYTLVRGCWKYDPSAKPNEHWKSGVLENKELDEKFYTANTRQNAWREQFNEVIQFMNQELDVDKVRMVDAHYLMDEDQREQISFIKDSFLGSRIYHHHFFLELDDSFLEGI